MNAHPGHMIAVSPKGHFKSNFWPKVKISSAADVPCRNFPCKRVKRIKTPLHLVNTMGYLSHRKSRCNFSFTENDQQTAPHMHHFYLYRTLPIHFKLALVTFWEKGLEQLLYQEKFQNVSISHVAENETISENGQYKQKIKYSDKHERGLVLPVSKEYMPTTDQTSPHSLYLMNGKRLHFEICHENESMDDETWLQKQAAGGNCFYDNVEEELWTPRPRDQTFLKIHKPVVDENKKLTTEINRLKRDLKTSEACWKNKLEASIAFWKNKFGASEARWKRKLEEVESENSKLKQENETKQAKITKFYEDEIARLNRVTKRVIIIREESH